MIKELRIAVEAMASAVRKVVSLVEKPSPAREEVTHVKEFLPEMEHILVDQLATSIPDTNSRQRILEKYELEFLQDELSFTEEQRREIEAELDSD